MLSVIKHVRSSLSKSKGSPDLRYLARMITGDRFTPLNEDTLTGRFLLYLNNDKLIESTKINNKFNLLNTLKHQPGDIAKFDLSEVITVLNALTDRKYIQNKHDFNKILQAIDTECCERSKHFDVKATINLLHSFMIVIPNRITTSHYFNIALEDLMKEIDKLDKDQLIQLIFFIGLLKKTAKAQNMLRKCMNQFKEQDINRLTKEDLCIICNSTFKTSTKIKSILLNKIKLYLNDNLCLLKDPAIFVTFIKSLRHNRYQDEDVLSTITCTMFFNKTTDFYSFTALVHILALYSDYLYYDDVMLNVFSKKCLNILKNSSYKTKDAYLENQPRLKDIKRFLWALSNLNYKLTKEDIESIIIPQVWERIKIGEFKNDPGSLVDIILYLWMMQYKAYDLIEEGLSEEKINLIRVQNMASQKGLNLLLTCIYYEDRSLYNSLKIYPSMQTSYNMNIQLKKRPVLKKIIDNIKTISVQNDIDKYDFQCQVPFINIIGIIGFQKKIYKMVNIEILDDYTCLKNTENTPTGLMQLKLRILDKCDEALIIFENPDIANCSDSELQHILQDEISLVC